MSFAKVSTLLAVCGLAGAASAQVTISHSTNNLTVVPGNSVACAAATPQRTTANFYWRSYDLATFPAVTGPFGVTSVTFAVENAIHPNFTQNVRVRLYKDSNGGAPVAVGTDLTQVAETIVAVPDGAAQFITAPIAGNFAQNDVLVVSVDTEDFAVAFPAPTTIAAAVFFIGSNLDPETGPSYLSAIGCGIAAPTTTAAIGFPTMHIILDVTGNIGPAGCYPDCNLDTVLNLADFGCFQTAFATGNMYADCNQDTVLNLADFGCFQTQFALGCP
jgi:hypothetical protein